MGTLKFFWLLSRQEPVVPDVHTCLEQHIIKHLHDDIASADVLEESSDFGPITIKIGSDPRRAYHGPPLRSSSRLFLRPAISDAF